MADENVRAVIAGVVFRRDLGNFLAMARKCDASRRDPQKVSPRT
jgi:hypothetical protein